MLFGRALELLQVCMCRDTVHVLTDILSATTGPDFLCTLGFCEAHCTNHPFHRRREDLDTGVRGCMLCECVHSGANVHLYIVYIVPDVILALEGQCSFGTNRNSLSMCKAPLLVSFHGERALCCLPPQLQVLWYLFLISIVICHNAQYAKISIFFSSAIQ